MGFWPEKATKSHKSKTNVSQKYFLSDSLLGILRHKMRKKCLKSCMKGVKKNLKNKTKSWKMFFYIEYKLEKFPR